MRLYSIQPRRVYDRVCQGQTWTSNPFDASPLEHIDAQWRAAYLWLGEQMRQRGRLPQYPTTAFPVWAWQCWNGKRQPKPDLRQRALRDWARDEPQVLLTLEVAEDRVLVSDYDAWHCVLNYLFLGDETASNAFDERCRHRRLHYSTSGPLLDPALHEELQASWQGIFDPDLAAAFTEQDPTEAILQATFWELRPDDVREAVGFARRGRTQRLPLPG